MTRYTVVLIVGLFCLFIQVACTLYYQPETTPIDNFLTSDAKNIALRYRDIKINNIVMRSGEVIMYDKATNQGLQDSMLLVFDRKHPELQLNAIPVSMISEVTFSRVNPEGTCLISMGLGLGCVAVSAGLVVAIIALTKESCPFIYSDTGDDYIFDAEPYGGAVCEGLKRTDWCALEHITARDRSYRIRIANEVDETQYTDEIKLLVIDHPDSVLVAIDRAGIVHTQRRPLPPLSAVENSRHDILPFVQKDDPAFWHSGLFDTLDSPPSRTRDELTFTFPRPGHARQVKIVLNACTTLWGSQMLKRFLELAGNRVAAWYKEQASAPGATGRSENWLVKAEMYRLKVMVETTKGWRQKAEFLGEGPFISENRVYLLDIGDVSGETLRIRIRPPVNFWRLNLIAVDYSDDLPVIIQEVSPISAVTNHGEDVRPLLETIDNRYLRQPEIGDRADIAFPAPETVPGMNRTVIAKVTGYYDIHLTTTKNRPDIRRLLGFKKNPEHAITYAIQQQREWQSQCQRYLAEEQ